MESQSISSQPQFTPFKLIVTIHYATNLAIADILSSDPYVVVNLDDKSFGRTKTIYSNLNPSWEQSFEIPLLHLRHVLRLKVFDEDTNKHDDFMGQVVKDLQDVSLDVPIPLDAKLKDSDNTSDTKGSLRYDIRIEQSKDLIKVVADTRSQTQLLDNSPCDVALDSEVVAVIQSELKAVGIDESDPVHKAILESPIVANHTTVLSKYMVRDLLHDVFSLTVPSSVDGVEAIFPGRVRSCVQVVSSTSLDLGSHKCSPAIPATLFAISILCYSSAWDTTPEKTVSIVFTNRYATWIWTMYFRLAVDYWRGVTAADDLPTFVRDSNFVLQTTTAVTLTVAGQSYSGIIVLKFNSKFKVFCEHMDTREVLATIDVSSLRDLIVTVDSSIPKKFSLTITSISLRLAKKEKIARSDTSRSIKASVSEDSTSMRFDAESPLSDESPTKSKARFPLLRKVSQITRNLASAATEVVAEKGLDAAKFATSNAASAVKTLASGDAVGALTAVTNVRDVGFTVGSTVMGAGSTVVNAVQNIHHGTFLQPMVHLAVRAGEKIVTLESRPAGDEVDWGDLDFKLDFDVDEEDLNPSNNDPRGMEIMLFKGLTGAEVPFASRFVPFTFFSKKLDSGKGRVPMKISNLLGLRVTLRSATGIKPLAVFHQASYCIYASCKCVKWNAAGRGVKFQSLKSKTLPAASNLEWKEEDFVLLAEHGIEWAQYIRVQLLHGHVLAGQKQGLGATSLGAIFIPFVDFSNTPKTQTFPLCNKNTGELVGGEVMVSFRRIQDEIDDAPKATLMCSLEEDDTVSWATQAILAGGAEEKQTPHEDFSLCPSFQGLHLSRFSTLESQNLEAALEASESLADASSLESGKGVSRLASLDTDMAPRSTSMEFHPNSLLSVSTDGRGIKYFEVFENERRSVRPPFSFGPGNLFVHPHFSDFTGKIKVDCENIEDLKPPVGCEWEGPWIVDRDHTKTDEEGWSYAVSYDYLVSNCETNQSHATAKTRASRRRKLKRAYREKAGSNNSPQSPSLREGTSATTPRARRNSAFQGVTGVVSDAVTGVASNVVTGVGGVVTGVGGVVTGVGGVVTGAVSTTVSTINPFHHSADLFRTGSSCVSRSELYSIHPDFVVNLCKERTNVSDEQLVIPWTQVVLVQEITESTLFIRVRLHRYFGINTAGDDVYHLADVDFFVYNCPSKLLKKLSAERIAVFSVRKDVMRVISSGNIDADKDNDAAESSAGGIPSTVDLSVGSHVAAQLDVDLQCMTEEIRTYVKSEGFSPTDLAALQFRECRLRLYVASLLRANIRGKHDFRDDDIDAIIARDFEAARTIIHDTDVATANNRIEYLLDAAETHLRDAALCGWTHRHDGRLKHFIERIVNSYLIEMVSLLGKFFDDNKIMKQVKGLSSKTQLILTFMRHNDRLGQLLDSALRPYSLTAVPRPQLQMFLRLDTLVAWYSTALEQEMCSKVDNVMLVGQLILASPELDEHSYILCFFVDVARPQLCRRRRCQPLQVRSTVDSNART
jgi:hypothetical protein